VVVGRVVGVWENTNLKQNPSGMRAYAYSAPTAAYQWHKPLPSRSPLPQHNRWSPAFFFHPSKLNTTRHRYFKEIITPDL
jgi:hypothetical protein